MRKSLKTGRATMRAGIFLIALCAALISCEQPGQSAPWITIFSANFNRADNPAAGYGRGEVYSGASPDPSSSISGNRILMTGGTIPAASPVASPAAIARSIALGGDFGATFSFAFPGPPTRTYLYVTPADMDADSGWYAMGFQPGHLGAWNADTALPGSVNPTLDPGHAFAMEIRREGATFTIVLTDTTAGTDWTATAMDDSYHDFTAIHLKAGYYDSAAQSVSIDDFVLQTR